MIDTLLVLFQLVCTAGFGWACYHLGRRTERRALPPPPKPLEAVCSCRHGYGKHRPEGCAGTTTVRRGWNTEDWPYDRYEDQILECGCASYDGPDPETVRMIRGA